jgi:hypothetical protein
VFAQVAIAVTGLVAVFLTQQNNPEWKRYACLFGVAGQPFWFWVTIEAQQWGILLMSVAYTYFWLLGVYNHWIRPQPT